MTQLRLDPFPVSDFSSKKPETRFFVQVYAELAVDVWPTFMTEFSCVL